MPDMLLQVLLVLLIVGVVLWGLSRLPIDAAIANLIRVVIIVFVAIWLIYTVFGLLTTVPHRHVLDHAKPSPLNVGGAR